MFNTATTLIASLHTDRRAKMQEEYHSYFLLVKQWYETMASDNATNLVTLEQFQQRLPIVYDYL